MIETIIANLVEAAEKDGFHVEVIWKDEKEK